LAQGIDSTNQYQVLGGTPCTSLVPGLKGRDTVADGQPLPFRQGDAPRAWNEAHVACCRNEGEWIALPGGAGRAQDDRRAV